MQKQFAKPYLVHGLFDNEHLYGSEPGRGIEPSIAQLANGLTYNVFVKGLQAKPCQWTSTSSPHPFTGKW